MSLGNALPTETAAASVNSCPVLQMGGKERKEWAKGGFIALKNGRFINVSGDSSALNQMD